MILIVAVKYATPLSLGSMYGLNEFYCPLRIAPSDTVYILTACGKTIHLCSSSIYITTVTTAVGDVLHLNACIPQGVAWGGSCLFVLTRFPSNIFHSACCSEECVTVCRPTCSRGKKSLEKFSGTPPPTPAFLYFVSNSR